MSIFSRRGLLSLAFMTVTILGVTQVPAHAAVGDLWHVRTIAAGIAGAVDIGPVNPLGLAEASAMSPDGASVYVASPGSGTGTVPSALSHFRRAADGSLTYAGCIGPMPGCGAISGALTFGMRDIVALQNNVYVLTPWVLLVFGRAACGDLWYQSCLSQFGGDPCVHVPMLTGGVAFASTLSGLDLYVLADGITGGIASGAVLHFRREAASGLLTFAGCVSDGRPECTATAAPGTLQQGTDIEASFDGGSVYVTAQNPGSVAHLRRAAATGSIAFAGCVGRFLGGCADPGTDALAGAQNLDIAPNGGSVYVAGHFAVTHLRRVPATGDIAGAGCLGFTAGCVAAGPNVPYEDLVVTQDGLSVYVLSWREPGAGRLIHLRRGFDSGDLAYAGCVGESTAGWCAEIPLAGAFRTTSSIVASVDSSSVYVTSGTHTGAITQFGRVT